jgi:parallel beta-helix repeat protein
MNKNFLLIFFVVSIISLVFIICGCLDNESTVKNVIIKGKDGTFFTIMDAINEASEGDTILVSKGVYNETLTIDKSITLIGINKDNTIISGNKTGDVIYITADYVNISGFTIINSGLQDYPNVDSGIDIRSDNNTISDNNLTSNDNCGIYIYSSSNNKINNNIFYKMKYGIYLEYSTKNHISSNIISSNIEYGIYLTYLSNNNTISDNIFTDNKYGARIKGSKANEIFRNLIKNNQMGLYFCCGGSDNIIFSNIFINNSEWHAKGYPINKWDDGTHGNYWDDYNGTDIDGDGIGDIPYEIIGYINQDDINMDRFPIIELSSKKK